ncbi:MAG: hypothetical protein IJA47_03550 [Oscillospiraceae bacterium]|nr:hypothetical protein [Oscillospiraceae bacterium]
MENEKRLIDAKEVAEKICELRFRVTGMRNGKTLLLEFAEKYRDEILRTICKAPTVDAVEVVHARKTESAISETGLMCTACYSDIDRDAVFCKYCGAKMDEGLKK